MDFKTGGQKVIERLLEAYGFTTRQALCDHLGVSKSTLARRYIRDLFPAEWVVQCALETGVSLNWLSTGKGPIYEKAHTDLMTLDRKKIINGKLVDANYLMIDKTFLPNTYGKIEVVIVGSKAILLMMDAKI